MGGPNAVFRCRVFRSLPRTHAGAPVAQAKRPRQAIFKNARRGFGLPARSGPWAFGNGISASDVGELDGPRSHELRCCTMVTRSTQKTLGQPRDSGRTECWCATPPILGVPEPLSSSARCARGLTVPRAHVLIPAGSGAVFRTRMQTAGRRAGQDPGRAWRPPRVRLWGAVIVRPCVGRFRGLRAD